MSKALISPTSTLTREHLVAETRQVRAGPRGRITKMRSVIPAHQAGRRYHHGQVFQQSFPTVPHNVFSNGGARATARLEGSQYTRNKSFALTFDVSWDAPCTILPAAHWFSRISFFTSGGSKHAQTMTSDSIEAFFNCYEHRQLDGVLALANSDASWGSHAKAAAGSMRVVIPLPATFLDNAFMDQDDAQDILIHLFPRAGILESGSAAITCNSAGCIVETDAITQKDRAETLALVGSSIMTRCFIDPVRVEYNAVQLGPSQRHQFSLENLSGNCAGLLLYIKSAGQAGAAVYNAVAPGEDALIDVKSVSNVSRWGAGQPVRDDYCRSYLFPRHFPGSNYAQNRAVIFVPFADDVKAALHGVGSGGCMSFSSARDTLEVTPGAQFASGQYDCVLVALMYKLAHTRNGDVSIENA